MIRSLTVNYSGLLITSKPGELDKTLDALKAFQNVEVHQIDRDTGRCIVVLEAEDTKSEVDAFSEISKIPSVMDVSLVVHHFEEEAFINPMVGTDPLKN